MLLTRDFRKHFISRILSIPTHRLRRTARPTMHTPEIASAFQPQELQPIAISCNSLSIKDVCKKGGESKTNIRKEPATCRNFQQVHWLCVWRLALFGKFGLAFINIHNAFVFTYRAKDRKPFRHRIRADFCPGFVIADRAVYPTVFYHAMISFQRESAGIEPASPGVSC